MRPWKLSRLAVAAPLALAAAVLIAAAGDPGSTLPGVQADGALLAATRATQTPTFNLCVAGAACGFSLPPAPAPACASDPVTKKCTPLGAGCAACVGPANRTCTGAAAAAPCLQSTVSCCNSTQSCQNTAAGCGCKNVRPPVAAGSRSLC